MLQTIINKALAGVCSECGNAMPKMSIDDINKRLSDCEDDDLRCDKCAIDFLVSYGWGIDTFEKCLPDLAKGELRKYIIKCEKKLYKNYEH
jgi:hypothetical protein